MIYDEIYTPLFHDKLRRVSLAEVEKMPDGTEIIWERMHYDSGTRKHPKWEKLPSEWFRTRLGRHWTVSGIMKDLHIDPDLEYPDADPWCTDWTYAGNSTMCQMWVREKRDDGK